jgi:uncharacterized membrane protein
MGNVAATPGFTRAIAGTGAVFVVFLIPHILAGLTAAAVGAAVMVSPKGTRRHVRMGTVYFWAMAALVVTAAGLTAIRGPRDLPVFGLGLLALALAGAGRHARRHPGTRNPGTRNRGTQTHILAMTSSYTVMLTAFYVDNGKNLPLADRLPGIAYWLLPAVIAAPLIVRSLRRHRFPPHHEPDPAAPGHQPNAAPRHEPNEVGKTRTGTPSCTR